MRLGIAPGSGEGFLAGDSINTASRIQSVAPEMGVAVGLATYEATAPVFDYEELEPATLKGKSEPVRVFHAKNPLARFGTDLTRTHDTAFIGREIDLALLKGIFDKTVAADSPQLVTVVGEPGLGKSRIVAELGAYIDTKPELITWRQGRCLPYGEGITFWALGEILKAHAGILESDPPDVATAKLDTVLPEGEERPWFRQRLLPLLGIEATSTAEREELFTAWRRFLEHVAEQDPTVLVFEDLHWADDAMLAFLEHLADRAEAVPLLDRRHRPTRAVRTPPRLRQRSAQRYPDQPRAAVGGGDRTPRLRAARDDRDPRRAPTTDPGSCGWQPPVRRGVRAAAEGQRPARQEGRELGAERRRRGPVPRFGPGLDRRAPGHALGRHEVDARRRRRHREGLLGRGDRRDGRARSHEVTDTLRELSRKELVRPARRSSIEGEAEYAFWHVLARDVAYGQLPRASRASRHVAAASGSSREPPSGSRTSPTCSPTTTPRRWSWRKPQDRPSRRASSKHPP